MRNPQQRLIMLLRAAATLLALHPGALAAQEAEPATQAPQPGQVYSDVLEVRVINVDVVVTDRSGRHVTDLGPDDFELRVDGEPMPISNFYSEAIGSIDGTTPPSPTRRASRSSSTFRPLDEVPPTARRAHVVVLIDHSRLRATNRKRAFAALREAIARLGKDDLIAVVGIESSLIFYSDFLFDRQAIDRILHDTAKVSGKADVLENERRQVIGELARGQSGGLLGRTSPAEEGALAARIRSYAAEEFNRSLATLRQIETVISSLAGVPGRKVLLYLGEGIPNRPGEGMFVEWRNRFGGGSGDAEIGIRRIDFNTDYERLVGRFDLTRPIDQLASAANRAGVVLYSIDAEDNHGGEIRSALTEQGATSEAVSVIDENYRAPLEHATQATGGRLLRSSGLLADQMVDLLGELHTFYSLGFTPPPGWQRGSDHRVEVKVKRRGLLVRHREEVRLPEADELEAGATVAALMYQTIDNPLGFVAIPGALTERQDGAAALPVTLEIPVENLGLVPQGDSHAGSLDIYVSIQRATGDPSRVQKIPFHLAVPDEKLEEARGEAAHYALPVVLRPGDRFVAIGIRDNVSGTFSALRVDVSELAAPSRK